MPSTFDLIGINIHSQQAFDQLAARADAEGERSRLRREASVLHGRCWKLGGGFEVWTMLLERARAEGSREIFYTDCRPAFRARHATRIAPWALTEFADEGEAMIHGFTTESGAEVLFELQNLTEVGSRAFQEYDLHVALCGLTYRARVCDAAESSLWQPLADGSAVEPPALRTADALPIDKARSPHFGALPSLVHENDWTARGRITACKQIANPLSHHQLLWARLALPALHLEVVISTHSIYDANGAPYAAELRVGDVLAADMWLQGHVFDSQTVLARYEGKDPRASAGEMWSALRRRN